jgi:phospholipid transport system substrate-binding protein
MYTLLKNFFLCALLLMCCLLIQPRETAAGAITDELKTVVDRVLAIMQDPAYAAPDKMPEKEKRISAAIGEKFDWEEMARRALGRHWRDFTPAQQKEFVAIFNQFLERTYVAKVALFLKEESTFSQKNIAYTGETVDGQYALVASKIDLKENEIPLNYKLINKGGKWVVYDLTLEGVGIVANYRTQFNELLANGSYEKLIEKLKSKQGEDIIEKKPAATAQSRQ